MSLAHCLSHPLVGNKTKKSNIAKDLQDLKTWSSNERSTPRKSELELYFEDTPMQLEEENSEDFERMEALGLTSFVILKLDVTLCPFKVFGFYTI
ncbi:hypothetical protein QL285_027714 [Trifolium repens]|nr:hypothetical protein QL285_027714 [Trifolium repens]